MSRVSLVDVEKRFGRVNALRSLTLHVEDREFLTLLGPSGCGKSTVLNIVAGLESPTSGDVYVDGRRVTSVEPNDRGMSMVFQSYALYPNRNVWDNIAFPLKLKRVSLGERNRRVREIAGRLGLTNLLHRRPAQLSGGQRQRVALARALVKRPCVFLMDEPLSNLDARLRTETRAEVKRLHREFSTTTIYVTHDQAEAMTLSDRIAILRDGELQQLGTPSEIYTRPVNCFVAGFIGSPGMNLVDGEIAGSGVRLPVLEIPLDSAARSAIHKARVRVGIRPEHIEIGIVGGARAPVDVVETFGAERLLTMTWGGSRVVARADASFRCAVGEAVSFRLKPGTALIFDAESGRRLPVDPL